MGKRMVRFAVLLCIFLFGLSACSSPDTKEANVSDGGFRIELSKPDTIKAGEKIEYTVTVSKDGVPVTNAEVIVNLEMADMDHGKNGFRAKMINHVYKGQASLPMGGNWIAYVHVKSGGVNSTKAFPFKVTGDMLSPEELKRAGLNENGALPHPDF
ncbi:FixH family protein [Aneurinibacillus terranovensis]|uniref:FixH family protein n=1 Tax=Aneurinibacillus terranovensis TaxID=278991 RepID=UPI0003FA12B3|nr:FixH family protein [Aneurinibacillus terranovensis]